MLADYLSDQRNEDLLEQTVEELLRQQLFGLAPGYENLNDHGHLRRDSLLAAAAGSEDVLGVN